MYIKWMLCIILMLTAYNFIHQLLYYKNGKETMATLQNYDFRNNNSQPSKTPATAVRLGKIINTVGNKTNKIGWKQFCERNQKHNISFAKYADKINAKTIVTEYGLDIKIPKTYAIVSKANDITLEMLDVLPEEYVFKANHGSSMTVIVKGNSYKCYGFCQQSKYLGKSIKLQLKFLQTNCRKWLSIDFSKLHDERFYSRINRKCFFEEMIQENDDYKIYVFHGKPGLFDVHTDRFIRRHQAFYTPSWRRVNMTITVLPQTNVEKPSRLHEILQIAHQLSRDFDFVRVDLYVSKHNIVFSEFTMTPAACKLTFTPTVADTFYGLLATGDNLDPESIISLLEENHDI